MNCMLPLEGRGSRFLVAATYLALISVPGHPPGYRTASTCVPRDYADEGQTGACDNKNSGAFNPIFCRDLSRPVNADSEFI